MNVEPFPWRCRTCNKIEVFVASIDYTTDILYQGKLLPLTVLDLQVPICLSCGVKVFTEEVDNQISNAFALKI